MMKTVTTITNRKATIRPMFGERKPPKPVGHRQWLVIAPRVLCDLAAFGYDAEWHCLGAAYVGAPQGRDRVWIVAYPGERRRQGLEERNRQGPRLKLRYDHDGLALGQRRAREALSHIRRMDVGTANGMDRIKACGNIAHPANVELIGRAILEADARIEGLAA